MEDIMGDGCCGSSKAKAEEKKTDSCSSEAKSEAKSSDCSTTEKKAEEKSGGSCGN